MRTILFILLILTSSFIFSQSNWSLSNSGIPPDYSPIDFTVTQNGDVYLACSKWITSSFIPKLLKSTDNGSNWTEIITTGLNNLQNTYSIICVGNKLLLAGSNSTTGISYVFSSTDFGQSWTLSNSGIPSDYVPVDFTITDNGYIYLACSKTDVFPFIPKLLKSTDNGSNWVEVIMTGLNNLQNIYSIICVGNKLLLAGSNSTTGISYVYSSTDSGQTWTLSNSGIPSDYVPIDFTKTDNGYIYLACSKTDISPFIPKLMKSTDNGNNWTEIIMTGLDDLQNTNSISSVGNTLLLAGSNSTNGKYYVFSSSFPNAVNNTTYFNGVRIFPNPTSEFIYIKLNPSKKVPFDKTEIISSSGIVLKSYSNNVKIINVSSLTKGVYFIKIYSKNIVSSFQFIKD